MRPPRKKAVNMTREELKLANAGCGHSFFDAPYGATVCNCGGKVVHQGHCQECWDKFREDLIAEKRLVKIEIKEDKADARRRWKLF